MNWLFLLLLIGFLHAHENELLEKLSMRERVAQLIIVAACSDEQANEKMLQEFKEWQPLYHLDAAYIEDLIIQEKIGGLIFYGPQTLPEKQVDLTFHFQSLSKKIPLFIALDAENGLSSRLNPESVLRFPRNMTLGAIHDPLLTYQLGFEIGQELRSLGVHIDFAPVIDVNYNPLNPIIGSRSFGCDPELVSILGIAFMNGLQDAGILACAKHFPGHGDTIVDSHVELPIILHDKARLEKIELYPFQKLIDAGIQSIMIAHLHVPALQDKQDEPSSLSPEIVTQLLQQEMGFEGIIFTDALGMKAAINYAQAGDLEVKALQAGADILVCPVDPRKAIESILLAIEKGQLSKEEINKKVLKILKAKKRIFAQGVMPEKNFKKKLKSKKAKKLKKKLYKKAITRVKSIEKHSFNDDCIILHICNKLTEFEKEITSLLPYKQYTLPSQATQEEIEIFLQKSENNSELIIAIHEMNSNARKNFGISDATIQLLERLKKLDKKVTVVLFGNAYSIEKVKMADQIILAYENDSDAQIAAARVLAGAYQAEGILPIQI